MRRLGHQPLADACGTLADVAAEKPQSAHQWMRIQGFGRSRGSFRCVEHFCCGKKWEHGIYRYSLPAHRRKRNKDVARTLQCTGASNHFHRDLVRPTSPGQRTAKWAPQWAATMAGSAPHAQRPKQPILGQLARCQVVTHCDSRANASADGLLRHQDAGQSSASISESGRSLAIPTRLRGLPYPSGGTAP